jgi:CRISPR-associated protein Cas5d
LAIYTYLTDVEYQVKAHFVWNLFRPELAGDRNIGKHHESALRALEKGGRQDIFLGTRECQGYVEPCEFGASAGEYDKSGVTKFGTMYHSISYPDENGTGKDGVGKMYYCSWEPEMIDGVIKFKPQEECQRRYIRDDVVKLFDKRNVKSVDGEEL